MIENTNILRAELEGIGPPLDPPSASSSSCATRFSRCSRKAGGVRSTLWRGPWLCCARSCGSSPNWSSSTAPGCSHGRECTTCSTMALATVRRWVFRNQFLCLALFGFALAVTWVAAGEVFQEHLAGRLVFGVTGV